MMQFQFEIASFVGKKADYWRVGINRKITFDPYTSSILFSFFCIEKWWR